MINILKILVLWYLFKSFYCEWFQENPEPFFVLAKSLYPGTFKVSF